MFLMLNICFFSVILFCSCYQVCHPWLIKEKATTVQFNTNGDKIGKKKKKQRQKQILNTKNIKPNEKHISLKKLATSVTPEGMYKNKHSAVQDQGTFVLSLSADFPWY
jgi:hypothetical protein